MHYPYLFLFSLLCLSHSSNGLVFRLPTLNYGIQAGESNLIAWSDFGDITAVNVYLAHGTPTNYTILQVVGDNVPSSTNSMMYHLPSTLPNDSVFFMLEGNDSPKTIVTRSVYVEPAFSFPSISLPSGFPSISLPSGFPISFPTAQSSPPDPTNEIHTHDDGPPIPMIVGIIVGVVGFLAIVLVTAILMKRRTIQRKRRALQLMQQRNEKPTHLPQKPMDINVNVAVQPTQDQQHTEYNVNYQHEYNYNPQYQYDQQVNYDHTINQQQPPASPIGPGGFVTPTSPPPKYPIPTGSAVPPTSPFTTFPSHDNGRHAETSPVMASSSISTSSTVVYPPDPAYQKFTSNPNQHSMSFKTATTMPMDNKPDDAMSDQHKPNVPPPHKPHSKSTRQKPHSKS